MGYKSSILWRTQPVFSFLLALFFLDQGYNPIASNYKLPRAQDPIEVISEAPGESFPHEFNMLVWNVYKGQDGNKWAQDFRNLAHNRSLVLIQEAMLDDYMPEVLRQETDKGFVFAKSFSSSPGKYTGVATGHAHKPTGYVPRRSPGREPVVNTPKMALLSKYKIAENHRLLVINIHSLNFVSNGDHYAQIKDLFPFIEQHKGPVVFAGDFNTWNVIRQYTLDESLKKYGLRRLPLKNDTRKMRLDHIYVRGCAPKYAHVRNEINTSDHFPLTARLNCPQ